MTTLAHWFAVDWGKTNLRVWVMGPDDQVLETLESDQGMGSLDGIGFEPALIGLVEPFLVSGQKFEVISCGMVGARQGWKEAPYSRVPCKPPGMDAAISAETQDPRLNVRNLPGVSQAQAPDVMRGEETQIAGFLSAEPEFDGVICLPGTHTKWVHISAGKIVSFRTFMTGEMYALLSENSGLRHGLADKGWDAASILDELDASFDRPQLLAAGLFSLRASGLLQGLSAGQARARLSGLLIGAELAGSRPYWLGQPVVLIGSDYLCGQYRTGLQHLGASAELVSVADITLAGLKAAYRAERNHG